MVSFDPVPAQYFLPLSGDATSYLAEDFLPADSNREAIRLLLETTPESWSGSALILTGPEGCGKTHLLSVWASVHHAQKADAETIERLVNAPETIPAVVLDQADSWAGDPEAEERLQHLYNAAKDAKAPLLLAARQPPARWGLALPDILSRLKSCPLVAISEPDDDLLRGLLIKQFSDRQLRVEEGVIEYLAKRLDRTGRAVRDTVRLLDEKALAEGRKISIPFIQSVLSESLSSANRL